MTIIPQYTPHIARTQAHEQISLLWTLAKSAKKAGNPSLVGDIVSKTAEITERYYDNCGKHAPADVLERLASLILFDDITDPHPDKMTREEYPIMSESQRDERLADEVSDVWADAVATDGRDYSLPTRENRRKLR
ncbi:hypothetical protein [uncultured Planococcus sp.]|uniref:hypothetical protein n=1 Tax=uncultured Planococcus sp. TaxID=337815 RepID=UPI0026040908|nr:hypothetical protein [uncultured Planococcus sp.]